MVSRDSEMTTASMWLGTDPDPISVDTGLRPSGLRYSMLLIGPLVMYTDGASAAALRKLAACAVQLAEVKEQDATGSEVAS